MPRWMKWLFIGFLAYLIFLGRTHEDKPVATTSTTVPLITEKQYPALYAAMDADRWKRGINPTYAPADMPCGIGRLGSATTLGFKFIDEEAGDTSSEGAACGEVISIRLVVWNNKGTVAYTGDIPITLGERAIATGLDAGLVDLHPKAVRTLILPPAALTRNAESKAPAALLAALPPGKTAMVTVTRLK